MLPEYDFSKGIRGKHVNGYQLGHTVMIRESNTLTLTGEQMDYERLWEKLKTRIRSQPPTGKAPNEFFVETVLQPVQNRIQVFDDYLMRMSENSEKPQRITKDDVLFFAKQAVESKDHNHSIADPQIKPPRMGSIICSMLHLLVDEFEYRPGRVLSYKRGVAIRT